MNEFLIAASVLIGLARPLFVFKEFNPHIQKSYQAAAHILVGVIVGLWLVQSPPEPWIKPAFWVLSIIEVTCAAITVIRKKQTTPNVWCK